MQLNKRKAGIYVGILSIAIVIVNIMIFFIVRGPNVDLYALVLTYTILSVIGIILAITSFVISRRILLLAFAIIGNGFVLVISYFLAIAVGFGR